MCFGQPPPPEIFNRNIPSSEMLKNTLIHHIVVYQGHDACCFTTFYTFVSLFKSALLGHGIIVCDVSVTILWCTGLFISWWQFTLECIPWCTVSSVCFMGQHSETSIIIRVGPLKPINDKWTTAPFAKFQVNSYPSNDDIYWYYSLNTGHPNAFIINAGLGYVSFHLL